MATHGKPPVHATLYSRATTSLQWDSGVSGGVVLEWQSKAGRQQLYLILKDAMQRPASEVPLQIDSDYRRQVGTGGSQALFYIFWEDADGTQRCLSTQKREFCDTICESIIQALMPQPEAAAFWLKTFGPNFRALWRECYSALSSGNPDCPVQLRDMSAAYQNLCQLVVASDGYVNVAKFAGCCRWFSTFRDLFQKVELSDPLVSALLSCRFFQGFMSRSAAEQAIKDNVGQFLMRFSSQPGSLAVSYTEQKRTAPSPSHTIVTIKILSPGSYEFTMSMASGTEGRFPSLDELAAKQSGKLKIPVNRNVQPLAQSEEDELLNAQSRYKLFEDAQASMSRIAQSGYGLFNDHGQPEQAPRPIPTVQPVYDGRGYLNQATTAAPPPPPPSYPSMSQHTQQSQFGGQFSQSVVSSAQAVVSSQFGHSVPTHPSVHQSGPSYGVYNPGRQVGYPSEMQTPGPPPPVPLPPGGPNAYEGLASSTMPSTAGYMMMGTGFQQAPQVHQHVPPPPPIPQSVQSTQPSQMYGTYRPGGAPTQAPVSTPPPPPPTHQQADYQRLGMIPIASVPREGQPEPNPYHVYHHRNAPSSVPPPPTSSGPPSATPPPPRVPFSNDNDSFGSGDIIMGTAPPPLTPKVVLPNPLLPTVAAPSGYNTFDTEEMKGSLPSSAPPPPPNFMTPLQPKDPHAEIPPPPPPPSSGPPSQPKSVPTSEGSNYNVYAPGGTPASGYSILGEKPRMVSPPPLPPTSGGSITSPRDNAPPPPVSVSGYTMLKTGNLTDASAPPPPPPLSGGPRPPMSTPPSAQQPVHNSAYAMLDTSVAPPPPPPTSGGSRSSTPLAPHQPPSHTGPPAPPPPQVPMSTPPAPQMKQTVQPGGYAMLDTSAGGPQQSNYSVLRTDTGGVAPPPPPPPPGVRTMQPTPPQQIAHSGYNMLDSVAPPPPPPSLGGRSTPGSQQHMSNTMSLPPPPPPSGGSQHSPSPQYVSGYNMLDTGSAPSPPPPPPPPRSGSIPLPPPSTPPHQRAPTSGYGLLDTNSVPPPPPRSGSIPLPPPSGPSVQTSGYNMLDTSTAPPPPPRSGGIPPPPPTVHSSPIHASGYSLSDTSTAPPPPRSGSFPPAPPPPLQQQQAPQINTSGYNMLDSSVAPPPPPPSVRSSPLQQLGAPQTPPTSGYAMLDHGAHAPPQQQQPSAYSVLHGAAPPPPPPPSGSRVMSNSPSMSAPPPPPSNTPMQMPSQPIQQSGYSMLDGAGESAYQLHNPGPQQQAIAPPPPPVSQPQQQGWMHSPTIPPPPPSFPRQQLPSQQTPPQSQPGFSTPSGYSTVQMASAPPPPPPSSLPGRQVWGSVPPPQSMNQSTASGSNPSRTNSGPPPPPSFSSGVTPNPPLAPMSGYAEYDPPDNSGRTPGPPPPPPPSGHQQQQQPPAPSGYHILDQQ